MSVTQHWETAGKQVLRLGPKNAQKIAYGESGTGKVKAVSTSQMADKPGMNPRNDS